MEKLSRQKHLVVGEQTKQVVPGTRIIGGDSSAVAYTVREVREDGQLIVSIRDLLTKQTNVAPMPIGESVIVEEKEQ